MKKTKLANELASEFLQPADKINSSLKTHNLHKLKEKFPDVSHEVIARRMCQFLGIIYVNKNGNYILIKHN